MRKVCLIICLMCSALTVFAKNQVLQKQPNLEELKQSLKPGNCLATGKYKFHETEDEEFYTEEAFVYPCTMSLETVKQQKFMCRNILKAPLIHCGTGIIYNTPIVTDSGFQIGGFVRRGEPSKFNSSECEQSKVDENRRSDVQFELDGDAPRVCEL